MRSSGRSWLVLLACIAALLAPGLSGRADAQMMMGGGMGGTTITKRDFDGFAKLLALSDDQRQAARVLLEGAQAQGRQLMEEFQKKNEELQEKMRDGDFTVMQKEMPRIVQEMSEKGKRVENQFLDDIRAILTQEQLDKWPSLERMRRRGQWLRVSFVSGAGVDLINLVDRAKIDEKSVPDLRPILEVYELRIDEPIQALQKMQEERTKDYIEGRFNPMDFQGIQKMMQEFAETAKRARDINREYFRKAMSVLPPDQGAAFEREFNRRSFPRVYRESHAEKLFKAAMGFNDLSAEQRSMLEEARAVYLRDAAVANLKWAKAIEEEEEKAGGQMGMMMSGFMGQGGGGAIGEARDARKAIDDRAEARVREALTPEQAARLPEREKQQGNPWMDMVDTEDMELPEEVPAGK